MSRSKENMVVSKRGQGNNWRGGPVVTVPHFPLWDTVNKGEMVNKNGRAANGRMTLQPRRQPLHPCYPILSFPQLGVWMVRPRPHAPHVFETAVRTEVGP